MTKTRTVMLPLLALTLLVGGGSAALGAEESESAPPSEPMSPEGVTWRLVSQAVDGALTAPPDEVLVTLVMQGGDAGGNGGCNSYFASYELAGESLSFSRIGATMMFCEGPGGEVESTYLDHLASVAGWSLEGTTLTLADASGTAILEFAAAPPASVVGSWLATVIGDDATAVVSSRTTSTITAELGADGILAGVDGCNDYSTTYTLDGSSITIAPEIVSTRMACRPDEVMEQAERYYAALVAASSWSLDAAGVLELRDTDGALRIRFEPVTE